MNFNLILKRVGFYVLSFTWGIITSFIGLVVILCLLPLKKVYIYHGRLFAVVGNPYWGGVSLGCFFLVCTAEDAHMLAHESGHGIQNAIMGPLFIFLVAIPSAARYWYRELKFNRKGLTPPTAYDAIWFEGSATYLGTTFVKTDRV